MRTISIPASTPIAERLRELGYVLSLDCGGQGRCGRCRVTTIRPDGARVEVLACKTLGPAIVDVSALTREERVITPELVHAPTAVSLADRNADLALAVDLGTTTIAAALLSLASGKFLATASDRNPQRDYGADVATRIAAAADPLKAAALRGAAVDAITALALKLTAQVGVEPSRIRKIAIAGNTVMEYLFAGRDVASLGAAPFAVPRRDFALATGAACGLAFSPTAEVCILPVVSAFVGGDALTGYEYLRVRGAFPATQIALLLDVGTNGELIFSDRGKLYASSTAAGPAFEGASISQGSLAVPGAIAGITLSRSLPRWQARTIANAPSATVCGSGMIDALAAALELGLVAPTGRIAAPVDLEQHEESWRVTGDGKQRKLTISQYGSPQVALTQQDIRCAQLAIGAMKAGMRLLLAAASRVPGELDALHIAGGFGAALSLPNAQRVGLLPPELPTSRIHYAGNTSLLGAAALLVGETTLQQHLDDLDRFTVVELAERPDFADAFAAAMRFPYCP